MLTRTGLDCTSTMRSSLVIFTVGLLSHLSRADWCSNFKRETLETYDCNSSFTRCKERSDDEASLKGTEPMTDEEQKYVKGGEQYDMACGDLAAFRISVCKAFKE